MKFSVRNIHQIELTSRCNLRCKYCLHPKMQREKVDMSLETLNQALGWVRHFQKAGTQRELNLAGIGESTMHESFIEFLAHVRSSVGSLPLVLATNGLLVTKELAEQMKIWSAGGAFKVYVSTHRPERAKLAIDNLQEVGLLAGVSNDPAMASTDWAGQIPNWKVTAQPSRRCPWVTGGWAVVLSDGTLTRCAFDGNKLGVIGHVSDDVAKMETSAYSLCRTCDQDPGVPIPEDYHLGPPAVLIHKGLTA